MSFTEPLGVQAVYRSSRQATTSSWSEGFDQNADHSIALVRPGVNPEPGLRDREEPFPVVDVRLDVRPVPAGVAGSGR